MDTIAEFEELFEEYAGVEDGISFKAEKIDKISGLMPEEVQDDLINAVIACPNGVYRFIPEVPDVVKLPITWLS